MAIDNASLKRVRISALERRRWRLAGRALLLVGTDQQRHRDRNVENARDSFQGGQHARLAANRDNIAVTDCRQCYETEIQQLASTVHFSSAGVLDRSRPQDVNGRIE